MGQRVGTRGRDPVGQRGQHTTEFVLVVALVVLAAVAMQLPVRRAVQAGIQGVTDATLGVDIDPPDSTAQLDAQSDSTVTEQGTSDFTRTTTTQAASSGTSVNEDARTQPFPVSK